MRLYCSLNQPNVVLVEVTGQIMALIKRRNTWIRNNESAVVMQLFNLMFYPVGCCIYERDRQYSSKCMWV